MTVLPQATFTPKVTMPDRSPHHFAHLLRQHRLQAGMSQAELAERAGLSRDGVGALEAGRRATPRLYTVRALAEALSLAEDDRIRLISAALAGSSSPVGPPIAETRAVNGEWGRLAPPPRPPTRLIGREHEVATIAFVLRSEQARLMTLTGPGGVGKTRLAIAAAEAIAEDFPHGVVWIELAHLVGPAEEATPLVAGAIARALGTKGPDPRAVAASLAAAIGGRKLLLVLDNFEHLLGAAPLIAAVLAACPELVILVTSRECLHLRGEREVVVHPLAVPDQDEVAKVETGLEGVAAIRLFVERAVEVRGDFVLTEANTPAVATLCRQLDGLPLAIELAVRWVKVLPPEALVERLKSRLPLLAGGADLSDRQQTMQNTIAWSYQLLQPDEQWLFRRLGVFAGGFTLEAADWVASEGGEGGRCAQGGMGGEEETDERMDRAPLPPQAAHGRPPQRSAPLSPISVLDLVASLVDKSLLRPVADPTSDSGPRFEMLETIREYGLERLTESGEADAVRAAHASHFLALAEAAKPELTGPDQGRWLARLVAEHDNLRAALTWVRDHGQNDLWLRLAGALWRFWELRFHLHEGRSWLEGALAADRGAPPAVRARALNGVANLTWSQGDLMQGAAYQEEALALFRAAGDRLGTAWALNDLANIVDEQGDYARAVALYEESLALSREIGADWEAACALHNLGLMADHGDDYDRAADLFDDALTVWERLGDEVARARSLDAAAQVAQRRGNLDRALALATQGLALRRRFGDRNGVAVSLGNLGWTMLERGEGRRAAAFFYEALPLHLEAGNRRGLARCLTGLAKLSTDQGRPDVAARLLGTTDSLDRTDGAVRAPARQRRHEQLVADVAAAMTGDAFAAAWAAGRSLSQQQAVAEATALADEIAGSSDRAPIDLIARRAERETRIAGLE